MAVLSRLRQLAKEDNMHFLQTNLPEKRNLMRFARKSEIMREIREKREIDPSRKRNAILAFSGEISFVH